MKKLILVVTLLTLTACSDSIRGFRINQAVDLCKSVNSSVNYVKVGGGIALSSVVCDNGQSFEGPDFVNHVVGSKEGKGDGS